MTLSDWVFDAGFAAILSENDAPAGGTNPTIKLRRGAAGGPFSGRPSVSTINGRIVTDIKQGIFEGLAKMFLGFASQARGIVFFRFVDINNHYRIEFNTNGSVMTYSILRMSAAVDTTIKTSTAFTISANNNVWFKYRITFWSSAGKCWIRLELADIGGNYVQQGADISDTTDAHTGAGIKPAIGLSSNAAGTFDASFDDMKFFKSLS